jgi:hypothetical protein
MAVVSAPLEFMEIRFSELSQSPECAESFGAGPAVIRSLLAHPWLRPDDVAAVVAVRGGLRIGRFGFLPGRMTIFDEQVPIVWGSSWSFDAADSNRAAAGLLLFRALHVAGNLGAWGISRVAFPIYQAAKFDVLTFTRRVFPLRILPVLRKQLSNEAVARAIAVPANLALRGLSKVVVEVPKWLTREVVVEAVPRFDEEIDVIDKDLMKRVGFIHGHEEINWALKHPWYGEQERFRFVPLTARSRGTGELLGYGLMRVRYFPVASADGYREVTLASLVHFSVRGNAKAAGLALFATMLEHARAACADIFECCAPDGILATLCDRFGMIRAGEMRVGVKFSLANQARLKQQGVSLKDFAFQIGEGDIRFS